MSSAGDSKNLDSKQLLSEFGINAKKGVTMKFGDDLHLQRQSCDCVEKGLRSTSVEDLLPESRLKNNASSCGNSSCTTAALCISAFVLICCMFGLGFYQMHRMQTEMHSLRTEHVHLKERVAELEMACAQAVTGDGGGGAFVGDRDEDAQRSPWKQYFGQDQATDDADSDESPLLHRNRRGTGSSGKDKGRKKRNNRNVNGTNDVPLQYLETPLKIFEPADWMEEMYPNQSGQPLVPNGNGSYTVKEGGLYLIYSSVLFHDVKHRQSQAVVVNGHKLFKCMDSVDYIDEDLPSSQNQAKYKSCTMTGVTQLKENDRLEVQNLYANTEIDLSTDATYFGAVLLAPSTRTKP
ncbi:hypothetical protein BaRGS_00028276 [Batillaria attramentaria]|uniref:THD domain-containing protein n=1 Tax=Batillaria attramentaria TaxID=370345 RepID=A0ABD0K054_9CAEN